MKDNLSVALTKCYFCQADDAIILNTRLTPGHAHKVEQMHGKIVSMDPCQKCRGYMDQGIILITIDDAKSEKDWSKNPNPGEPFIPNPWRTGGWFVVTDDAIRKLVTPPELADWAIRNRWMFIEHEAAEKIGLFEAAKTAPQG